MTGEIKRQLGFKARLELGKEFLKTNPTQADVIVRWIITL